MDEIASPGALCGFFQTAPLTAYEYFVGFVSLSVVPFFQFCNIATFQLRHIESSLVACVFV